MNDAMIDPTFIMFIDSAETHSYDVIIIGTGPAGISTALRVAEKTAARILLIESGGLEADDAVQSLSNVAASGDLPGSSYTLHSQRLLGGTSNLWVGYCTVLERRSFDNGEWPIGYEALEPYYVDAATLLELPPEAHTLVSQPVDAQGDIVFKPFYLSSPTRFGDVYRQLLADSTQIDVLLHATCKRIVHSRRAEAVIVQDSRRDDGDEVALSAEIIVTACGGVGNPRLLLLSGIGAEAPVGNYFMEHPHIYDAGTLWLDREKMVPIFRNIRGLKLANALQLSDDYCRANGLLNFSIDFSRTERDMQLLLGQRRDLFVTSVTIRSEMLAQSANRIFLGDGTDRLGQAETQAQFEYRYRQLAMTHWEHFNERLLRHGIGRLSLAAEPTQIFGGGHLMGTTRMGISADNSVVDANCQVHGVDNLYVAGSSIFAAGGAANPTYSIVAFALRLGDHLAEQLA